MSQDDSIKRALQEQLDRVRADETLQRHALRRIEETAAAQASDPIMNAHRNYARRLMRDRFMRIGLSTVMLAMLVVIVWTQSPFDVVGEPVVTTASVPNYVPEGYSLTEVEAVQERGSEPEVVIRYAAAKRSDVLELKQSRSRSEKDAKTQWEQEGFTRIELPGQGAAWIKKTSDDTLQLFWEDERYRYKLSGKLDEDDARKMAGSMTLRLKEAPKR